MARKLYLSGDSWSVWETESGYDVRDPDWSLVKVSRKQADILSYPGKHLIVNAGTGFGKDWIGVEWAKKLAKRLRSKRVKSGFRRGGPLVTVAICAPTEPNYLETWDKLKAQLPQIPGNALDGSPNYICHEGKRKSITLFGKNGIRFEMVTLFNANSVRGRGWDICLITEAAFMKKTTFRKVVLKRVNRGGYYGAIMLISTPNNGWFDDACDDAEHGLGGEFSMYRYFEATSYDNPLMSDETRAEIRAQEMGNPLEHAQERLAKRHVKVIEGTLDCPFDTKVVLSALSMDKPQVTGRVLLFFDLQYGGTDNLGFTAIDENTRRQIDVRYWTAKELGISGEKNIQRVYAVIKDLMVAQAERYRPCRVGYDRQGQLGGALINHLPGWMNPIPETRNRDKKNGNVEDLLLRMQTADKAGRSVGILLLDPKNPYLTPKQREAAQLQYDQIVTYQKVYDLDDDGNPKIDPKTNRYVYYYTKGPYGDDLVDADTWACGLLPPLSRPKLPNVNPSAVNRALYL
jgi:hypothetical protein